MPYFYYSPGRLPNRNLRRVGILLGLLFIGGAIWLVPILWDNMRYTNSAARAPVYLPPLRPLPTRVDLAPSVAAIKDLNPTPPDGSQISLMGQGPGVATPPPLLVGGHSTIGGQVTSPGAATGMSTVQLVRVVQGVRGAMQVNTDSNGLWNVSGLPGGVYVLRAWQSPIYSDTSPSVIYISGDSTNTENLTMTSVAATNGSIYGGTIPNTEGGQAGLLSILYTSDYVDASGIIQSQPVVNIAVTYSTTGAWTVPLGQYSTNQNGVVQIPIVCSNGGPGSVAASLASATVSDQGVCAVPPPPPTTTTTTPPTSLPPTTNPPGSVPTTIPTPGIPVTTIPPPVPPTTTPTSVPNTISQTPTT